MIVSDTLSARPIAAALSLVCLSLFLSGCGGGSEQQAPGTSKSSPSASKSSTAAAGSKSKKPKPKFEAVTLGDESAADNDQAGSRPTSTDKAMDSVVEAMQPLQIMLGKWRGTTNSKVKGFSASEELEWIWDFRTDRAQPALVVKSEKGPYIRDGRLTFLTDKQAYQLTATSPTGVKHVMEGNFEREPEDVTGDDNKPQRTYKLVLTETDSAVDEAWRVAFDQQENNRYLVQLSRKRGQGTFQPLDVVGTQRLGTSFAISDDDYGDKKCIISGGLGTTTVSYNGKTYWVCCSGCLAAFNEDPKRWVTKREEADKAKSNQN